MFVELAYRKPIATVEVAYRGRPELLLIDEQAILLPSPTEAFVMRNLPDLLLIRCG